MDDQEVLRKRGKSSKAKGKRYEKEIADLLSKYFPDAKPGRSQTGPRESFLPDVSGVSKDTKNGRVAFWVECKSQKRTNPKKALEQAEQEALDAGDPRPGLVFAKDPPIKGKKNEFVCMRPETFMHLLGVVFTDLTEDSAGESDKVQAILDFIKKLT